MRYLFIIDYEHLDNGGFLKLLSKKLAGLRLDNFMLLHGESAHTDRIVQTGVMREQARIRAIKELNHRLTALFADEGIPLIAMNGFQRNTIQLSDKALQVDAAYLRKLGSQTHVLLSSLVAESGNAAPKPVELDNLAGSLQNALSFDHIIAFDASEEVNEIFAPSAVEKDTPPPILPKELKSSDLNIKIVKMRHMDSIQQFEEAISI